MRKSTNEPLRVTKIVPAMSARSRACPIIIVTPARFERATYGLGNRRSIHLSYGAGGNDSNGLRRCSSTIFSFVPPRPVRPVGSGDWFSIPGERPAMTARLGWQGHQYRQGGRRERTSRTPVRCFRRLCGCKKNPQTDQAFPGPSYFLRTAVGDRTVLFRFGYSAVDGPQDSRRKASVAAAACRCNSPAVGGARNPSSKAR